MTQLLMIVTSARSMRMADGSEHPTGYWAEEVLEPIGRFGQANVDLVIATADGQAPQPDPWGLEPSAARSAPTSTGARTWPPGSARVTWTGAS